MSSLDGSIPIRSDDYAPVMRWLSDLRGRVTRWSTGVREVSGEEWTRLQGAVRGALSTQKVEEVLGDFLKRVGVQAHSEEAHGFSLELRSQILTYREGQTIESYAEHFSAPPKIRL